LEGTSMDEIEGYALAEQWEEVADRFIPSSAAAITVTLTAEEAQQVHDAMTFGVGYLLAAIEADRAAGVEFLNGGGVRAKPPSGGLSR
jgi:hypothetical protein